GRVWFFVRDHGALYAAKMTTGGQVDRFRLPDGATPDAITAGPDGALWYAGDGRIGRLDTGGNVTEFPVPALRATGIAPGPAGAHLARGAPAGDVTRVSLPGGLPADGGITTAADGTIWFSAGGARFDEAGSSVGRYDPAGGGTQGFRLSGRALDVVRGPGSS